MVDYSFHCSLTDINEKTLEQMADIVDMGITLPLNFLQFIKKMVCMLMMVRF